MYDPFKNISRAFKKNGPNIAHIHIYTYLHVSILNPDLLAVWISLKNLRLQISMKASGGSHSCFVFHKLTSDRSCCMCIAKVMITHIVEICL